MSLKKQIDDKLNEALKAKDKNIYPTLRLIISSIKDAEIAGRSKGLKEIKDSEIIALLKKMIKQRNESCEVYEKAGRSELLENEKKFKSRVTQVPPRWHAQRGIQATDGGGDPRGRTAEAAGAQPRPLHPRPLASVPRQGWLDALWQVVSFF